MPWLVVVCNVLFLKGMLLPVVSRRSLLQGTSTLVSLRPDNSPPPDPYSHWSFWGMAPPPIKGTWTYDRLIEESRAGHVATVQIAVQHDCVIATTPNGYRYASMIADSKFQYFLLDAIGDDNELPFRVLPMDTTRAKVRSVASRTLGLAVLMGAADVVGILNWTTFDRTFNHTTAIAPEKEEAPSVEDEKAREKALRQVLGLEPFTNVTNKTVPR